VRYYIHEYTVLCRPVSVGTLLGDLTDTQLRDWGEDTAVQLVEHGADVDEIGHKHGTHTLHYLVRLSMRLGL